MNTLVARITRWLKYPLAFSIVVNLILFLLTYLLFDSMYRTNDDVFMMLVVSGKLLVTEPDSHLLFMNILIGDVLKSLYTAMPSIHWYSLFMVGSLFVAHVVLLFSLIRLKPHVTSVVLYLVYFLFFGMDLILLLQFTIVGFMLVISGLFLLLSGSRSKENDNKVIPWKAFVAVLMICIGSMVRWDSLVLAIVLFIPLNLILLFDRRVSYFKFEVPILMLAILVSFALRQYNTERYVSDQEWSEYYKAGPANTSIIEQGGLWKIDDKNHRQDVLDKVGWTYNDYRMLCTWFYSHDIYNIEAMLEFMSHIPKHKGKKTFRTGIVELKGYFFQTSYGRYFLIFVLAMVFFASYSKKNILTILISLFIVITLIVYLVCYSKSPPMRVFAPMMVYLTLLMIFSAKPSGDLKRRSIMLVIFLVLFGWFPLKRVFAIKQEINLNNNLVHSSLSEFTSSSEALYVSWGASFPLEYIRPFEDHDYLNSVQIFLIGSYQRTPIARRVLDKYGVKDLYNSIVHRDDVYLILSTDKPEYKISIFGTFMEEHYTTKTTAKELESNRRFNIYQFGR